jgi:hypothetical protein
MMAVGTIMKKMMIRKAIISAVTRFTECCRNAVTKQKRMPWHPFLFA